MMRFFRAAEKAGDLEQLNKAKVILWVKTYFPYSKFSEGHVTWYRNVYRRLNPVRREKLLAQIRKYQPIDVKGMFLNYKGE